MAYIPFSRDDEAPFVPSPWDVTRRVWARASRGWTARRDRHEIERLLEFDPALLRDIGVSRDDVRQALTTREPSVALERAARGR